MHVSGAKYDSDGQKRIKLNLKKGMQSVEGMNLKFVSSAARITHRSVFSR